MSSQGHTPAFRQGTFCQNLLSGVRVTFTQPQNERLAYEFVDRLAPLRLILQKNLKADSLPMISQSRIVRTVRFSEYQIIFADFILPQICIFRLNTEYKNEKKAQEFEADCEVSYRTYSSTISIHWSANKQRAFSKYERNFQAFFNP